MSAPPSPDTRPRLMGILNLTPDSFSDGGLWLDPVQALDQALRLEAEGADAIDLGAESTRPGAQRVGVEEQWRRLGPVLEKIAPRLRVPISVDTTLSEVARRALAGGAGLINDISAGLDDPDMLPLAARSGCPIVLMHKKGDPATMQQQAQYADVVAEVKQFLMERLQAAREAGVAPEKILLDPGIGFAKTTAHNLTLLARISELVALGQPVLLGVSRKRFLGEILDEPDPLKRDMATAAVTACGVGAGVAWFRVHDVKTSRQAMVTAWAIRTGGLMQGSGPLKINGLSA